MYGFIFSGPANSPQNNNLPPPTITHPPPDIIAIIFFPPAEPGDDNEYDNLLKSFVIFGGAFLMRPIGGLLIGYIVRGSFVGFRLLFF